VENDWMGQAQGKDPRDQELETLRRENQQLRERVHSLERRIAELEEKLQEALRASKRQAAPFSKGEPKAHPRPRGRKVGQAYGKKGHLTPPSQVDEVLPVPLPEACPHCGGSVERMGQRSHYQVEIPRKPLWRRFDVEVGQCQGCGHSVQARHPLQHSDAAGAAAVSFGPQAQAMTALMKSELGLSYGDIVKAYDRFFGLSLTRGGAAQMVLRAAERLKEAYGGIEIVIRRSRVLYPDETGWKVGGWRQWLWALVAKTATLFAIRDSRGHEVPAAILGLEWSGAMTRDGYAAYDCFLHAVHQQCLAHISRRCKALLEGAVGGAVHFPRKVLDLIHDALVVRDRRDAGDYSPHGVRVAIGRLEARLERLLEWIPEHEGNRKLSNHLDAHRNEILLFLKRPGLEATSWPADHAIRPAVVNRKVFGGNRDERGARAQERLISVVSTCVQRGVEVFEYLAQVLRAPFAQGCELACSLLQLPMPP
jgi:transposase